MFFAIGFSYIVCNEVTLFVDFFFHLMSNVEEILKQQHLSITFFPVQYYITRKFLRKDKKFPWKCTTTNEYYPFFCWFFLVLDSTKQKKIDKLNIINHQKYNKRRSLLQTFYPRHLREKKKSRMNESLNKPNQQKRQNKRR